MHSHQIGEKAAGLPDELARPKDENECFRSERTPNDASLFEGLDTTIEGGITMNENSLHESERRFRLFVEYAPGAIAMFDREMRYLLASRRWLDDYRIAGDPTGHSQYEIFPDTPQHWKERHRRGLAGESLRLDAEAVRHGDGKVQWIKWEIHPWRDAGGGIGGLLIAAEDLTTEKQLEQELRASEKRFQLAVQGTNDGLWDWNLATNEVYWSERTFQLLGFQLDEIPSRDRGLKIVHPDDRQKVSASFRAHIDQGLPYDAEYRLRTKSGEYRWFAVRGAALRDQTGKPSRMVGVFTDITERILSKQHLEAVLQNTDEQLHALIEASPLAIGAIDREGRVISWNRAAEQVYGYTAAEVIGRINPGIPAAEVETYPELLAEVLSGKTMRVEAKRIRKDGTEFDAALYYSRFLTNPGGEPSGIVVCAEDITLRKRAEEELRLASVRAALAMAQDEEARRIARELHDDILQRLAVLSMEIGGDANHKRRSRESRARLQSYQKKLSAIGEGIRQISHQMHATVLDDFGLAKALEELCLEARSEWLGLSVEFRAVGVPKDLPKPIASCLYRVTQAALNNVARHSQAKDATVTLKGSLGLIEVIIADSGRGFDTAAHQTGLGLASMRERVGLLNGSVSIISKPGYGTVVTVKVPFSN